MKHLTIFFFIILGLFRSHTFAQTCLTNGLFSQDASCITTATCSTWPSSGTGCNGWIRSHGTPQVLEEPYPSHLPSGTQNIPTAYLWASMSGTETIGEGMFTGYAFQANHTYDVQVEFFTSSAGGGALNVYAANGLTQHADDGCSDPLPTAPANFTNDQLIGTYPGSSVSENTLTTYTFTANGNYQQLWIYPTSTSATQFNLFVEEVYACPSCSGLITYNSGTVPTGESAAGNIVVGSSEGTGGSGTVGITPNATTTLVAANGIVLGKNFQASVTTGTFSAQIVACTSNIITQDPVVPIGTPLNPIVPVDTSSIQSTATNASLTAITPNANIPATLVIYPTVSSGAFTLTGSPADLNNANIIVVDESGRTVYSMYNATGTTIPLNLGNLSNGLYFVQIRQQNKGTTQKIIINK